MLDIPLPELQGLKTLRIGFHHATKDEVVIHTIRLPKESTVGDVIDDLKTKVQVELSHPNVELRLFEVFYLKVYKIFPLNEKIENINDQYWLLRAEEIPEEEKNLGPHDGLIHVYHFMKNTAPNHLPVENFGEPFLLVINEGEILKEVKVRMQKKLQVPDEEFSKREMILSSLVPPPEGCSNNGNEAFRSILGEKDDYECELGHDAKFAESWWRFSCAEVAAAKKRGNDAEKMALEAIQKLKEMEERLENLEQHMQT